MTSHIKTTVNAELNENISEDETTSDDVDNKNTSNVESSNEDSTEDEYNKLVSDIRREIKIKLLENEPYKCYDR